MANPDDEPAQARRKAMRKGAAMLIYFGVMVTSIAVAFDFTHYAPEGGTAILGVLAGIALILCGVGLGVYTFMAGRR